MSQQRGDSLRLRSFLHVFTFLAVTLAAALVVPGNGLAGPRGVALSSGTHRMTSTGQGVHKTAPQFFHVYGAPGTLEGQFETAGGNPDPQGWEGTDLTAITSVWRVSQTNSETLNPLPGNHGIVCQHTSTGAGDYDGYGNNWDEWLLIEIDVEALGINPFVDPATVQLSFTFVRDLEDGFDFFYVDRSLGSNFSVLDSFTGSSFDPGSGLYAPVSFNRTFTYAPNQYAGGKIVLRLRVDSNTVASDQDGFWPTDGRGAAAVDDIRVVVNSNIVSIAGWEPNGPGSAPDHPEGDITGHDNGSGAATDGWQPISSVFVGDFAKIFSNFQDLDPCVANRSPQFGFIDDGTPPDNDPLHRTTGGSISSNWSYGTQNGFVVNYTGGIQLEGFLYNTIWSPPLDWDLPGSEDDVANGGAILRFDVWSHLPLDNGLFYLWQVRSRTATGDWTPWRNFDVVYFEESPRYESVEIEVGSLLENDPEQVQVSLGVRDLSDVFDLPGADATPSPLFDNVEVIKYALAGPVISARNGEMFHDSFPNSGQLNYDPVLQSNLAIRLDMAIDIGPTGGALIPGDSIVIDVDAIIPGTSLDGPPEMVWQLRTNPAFDEGRRLALLSLNATDLGGGVHEGVVDGQRVTSQGVVIEGRWFFDLPDGAANPNAPHQSFEDPLFFPGDKLRYYFRATDDAGNVTTLPADLSDFDFEPPLAQAKAVVCPKYSLETFNKTFTTAGVPSIWVNFSESSAQDAGKQVVETIQPDILLWNDYGLGDGSDLLYEQAFYQLGLYEMREFDVYHTREPENGLSDGLGASAGFGANADQLAGYDVIIYVSGDQTSFLINDGSDSRGNDKGNDVSVLTEWHGQRSQRNIAYFGDNLGSGLLAQGGATQTYLNSIMGLDVIGSDVRPVIDDQVAPLVIPKVDQGVFFTDYVAFGGCSTFNQFDQIQPLGVGAAVSHEFTDPARSPYLNSVPASVYWSRFENAILKNNLTFAHGFRVVRNDLGAQPEADPRSVRADLLGEIISSFGRSIGTDPTPSEPVSARKLALDGVYPNPFNPSTTIRFSVPANGRVSVAIYNTRGERVTTLLDREMSAGEHDLRWNGVDRSGARVASGIYLVEVRGFGQRQTQKIALVK